MRASASFLDRWNPLAIEEETQDKITNTINTIDSVITWFKNFKEHVAQYSIDFMVWSYDAITSVVLHTPTFLFDSNWFKDNVVMFTGISVALSICLSMYEGFSRILGHIFKDKSKYTRSNYQTNRTDMARISRRIPLVVIGSAIAPACFYYGFKGINWLTNTIIDIGKYQMAEGISGLQFSQVSWLELLIFLGFDIALLGMMIPVFLQNFRRWFDLLALGMITPLALSCWVFKEHEHHFKTWWNHIKKCSTTQVIYAIFLLIIGSLMFGTKMPETTMEIVVKIGVVIGGLWRMANPPSFMKSRIDVGDDVKKVWEGAGQSFGEKSLIGKGISLVKIIKGRKLLGGISK